MDKQEAEKHLIVTEMLFLELEERGGAKNFIDGQKNECSSSPRKRSSTT